MDTVNMVFAVLRGIFNFTFNLICNLLSNSIKINCNGLIYNFLNYKYCSTSNVTYLIFDRRRNRLIVKCNEYRFEFELNEVTFQLIYRICIYIDTIMPTKN